MESNKENQEGPAASVSVASPRVSSVGAPSEGGDHPAQQSQPQGYQPTPYSDHLHWGGVQRMLHARSDARSVASSAAADRDDKSIYAEDVGALDAHTEGDEHDEDDHEDEPEELTLTQVQGELRDLPPLRHEPSAVESAFTGISAAGSLADVVDQLADQAVAGELSPRQAAAAIRSATAARGGLAEGSADDGSAGGAGGSSSVAAAVDALDGGESVASLPHRSSIAPSEDGWHGAGGLGGSSTADMMDSIPLEAEAPPAEALPAEAPPAADEAPLTAAPPAEQPAEAAAPAAAVGEAADGVAPAEPAAAEDEAGEQQQDEDEEQQQDEDEEQQQEEEEEEEPALPESKSAHDVAAVLDAAEVPAVEEEPSAAAAPAAADGAAEQDGDSGGGAPAAATGAGAVAAAAAAAAAGAVARKPSGSAYRSRLMQQLTASGSEDDITVYSSADIAGGSSAARQDPLSQAAAAAAPQQVQQPAAAAGSGGGMQPLSIANGGSGGSGVMPEQDTAKALAAINAAASNSAAGEGGEAAAQPELLFPPQWYQTFKGLLYMDGVDSLGRPVVVLNADAVPPNMKASALVFVKAHLEPLVNQGDYVLVFTSRGHARLPSMWIMGAYRSLPRPFRKNVQHVVLVRPSAFLRTVLAFMRPFVSKKAHRKIKQVQSVHDIAAATEGEVTLASLGPAFSAELLAAEEEAAAAAAPAAGGGTAPAAGGSAGSSP